ncbi:uncharacterized protein L201_006768 [Kwoniella dendrophila CBS 6074]|uniref:Uncharacterized protein n=1 Tax=Kwoniella dendrophila CBS 6074 TaxID=1295534 RepID=A0AAX4K2K5_9TREE
MPRRTMTISLVDGESRRDTQEYDHYDDYDEYYRIPSSRRSERRQDYGDIDPFDRMFNASPGYFPSRDMPSGSHTQTYYSGDGSTRITYSNTVNSGGSGRESIPYNVIPPPNIPSAQTNYATQIYEQANRNRAAGNTPLYSQEFYNSMEGRARNIETIIARGEDIAPGNEIQMTLRIPELSNAVTMTNVEYTLDKSQIFDPSLTEAEDTQRWLGDLVPFQVLQEQRPHLSHSTLYRASDQILAAAEVWRDQLRPEESRPSTGYPQSSSDRGRRSGASRDHREPRGPRW